MFNISGIQPVMSFLEKIQNLSLKTRKIIFWLILVVLAAGLCWWWFGSFQKRLDDFRMGRFIEQLNLPKINIPKINTNAQ